MNIEQRERTGMAWRVMTSAVLLLATGAAAALPRFLGIEFGQALDVHDEAVLKSYGLGKPVTVTRYPEKKTYYQCDSTAPKDGFDSFSVDVSLDGKVFCISAEVMCKDRDEASRKTKEISADLKKRYGDMVDENGKVLLEVTSDGSCVTVDFRQAPAAKPPPHPPAAKAAAK